MSITLMSLSILTSIFLDTCLSDHPSVGTCLSEHLFICLNVQLCECLFICLNVCLNICLCEWFPFEKSICINICPFVWILMGLRAHVLESVWHTPIYRNTSICLNVFWMSICLKVCLCECLNNHLHEPLSICTDIHLNMFVCINICPCICTSVCENNCLPKHLSICLIKNSLPQIMQKSNSPNYNSIASSLFLGW